MTELARLAVYMKVLLSHTHCVPTCPYQDQVIELIVEEPSFSVWDFLANVGGVMGLYAGMSLITLLEVYTIGGGLRISLTSIGDCKIELL